MKSAWNKGKRFPHSKEHEVNRLAAVRAALKFKVWPRGYRRPKKHTQPMLDALHAKMKENPEHYKKVAIANLPKDINGSKNGNWKGGITAKTRGIRFSKEYKHWRATCLKRDGEQCKLCGSKSNLQIHHIIPISECNLIACLRMNGVTLCKAHHYENDKAWKGKRFTQHQSSGKTLALIFTIPHKFQEYSTVGNWQIHNGFPVIFVSELSDWRREALIAIHELVEVLTCTLDGVTQEIVDKFDMEYEKNRPEGDESEPGDASDAPYRKQHCLATGIERILAAEWGVDWKKYEDELCELPEVETKL